MNKPIGVALGIAIDLAVGEPKVEPHPVAAFGTAMKNVENRIWANNRKRGIAHLVAGGSIAAGVARVFPHTWVATYIASAPRGLIDAARRVEQALLINDLDEARRLLPWLVGRDPTHLDESEIARAVIESLAESTVDAIIAPAFWGLIGGASGALVHRAVNTLDSMVGHHSERYEHFGWASARLDDVMAYVPARIGALLVCVHFPDRAQEIWRITRRDAPGHPSPNAGVIESAFAAALCLQLGGSNTYEGDIEDRAKMGEGRRPQPTDIHEAIVLVRKITQTIIGFCVILGVLLTILNRKRQ